MLTFPAVTGGGSSGPSLSNATPLVEAGNGNAGTGTAASRDDHVHPALLGTAVPLPNAPIGVVGTGTAPSREDHVHPVAPPVNARFAPTAALPLYTISGVGGSTMTMNATGALAAQDGVTAALNDLFYYDKDNVHAGVDNGLWKITTLGAVGVAMVATRVAPLAAASNARGVQVAIFRGTTRQGETWLCTNDVGSDTVGTNALTFVDTSIYGNQGTATPVAISSTGAVGTSNKFAREDHTHGFSRTSSSYSGAGPYTIAAAPTDRVTIDPQANNTVVANLPSIADPSVVDGFPITFSNVGVVGEQIVFLPNGSDTIGGIKFYRCFGSPSGIFPGGSVTLVANKSTNNWIITNELKGSPINITITVQTSGGSSANPGTAALPTNSFANALRLIDTNWSGTAIISLLSGFSESSSATYFIPGPHPGTQGSSLNVQGPLAMKNAITGVGTITATGGSAATTTAFRKVTFANTAGLANNAGQQYFLKGQSGSINNRTVPIKASSATSVEYEQTGSAITSGTFTISTPDAKLTRVTLKPGSGNAINFQDVDLGDISGAFTCNGLIVGFTRVRVDNLFLLNCQTSGTFVILYDLDEMSVVGGTCSLVNFAALSGVTISGGAQFSVSTYASDDSAGIGWVPHFTQNDGSFSLTGAKVTDTDFTANMSQVNCTIATCDIESPSNFILNVPFIFTQCIARMTAVTGNVGSGVTEAVTVKHGSNVLVDASTTINANGAGNAVRVGAQGIKSWATIAGDANADVSDFGAATGPQGVSVRRAL